MLVLDLISSFLLVVLCHLTWSLTLEENEPISYDGFQVWSFFTSNIQDREFVEKIQQDYDLEIWRLARDGRTDLVVPPDFLTELKLRFNDENISFNVTVDDLQTAINSENANSTDNEDELENRFSHRMDWDSYHRLDDIYGYLNYLADTYPNTVQVTSIGSSSEGRPLRVVRISSNTNTKSKPAIWIDGGIHAREWISPAVVTYFIQQLVEFPENEYLIRNVDWYIMPVANPDGYEYTHAGNRLWRKTRSQTGASTRCRGVDPNRNFGYRWNEKGVSRDACSEIYCGSNSFSEPETRAMSNFILGKSKNLKMYLTFHSYGQYWLIPWGYDVAYPSDYNDLKSLAQKAASRLRKFSYTIGNSAELLYPASGGSDDWAKGAAGIKYSYTIELPDSGRYGFILPSTEIKSVCHDFFPALQVLGEHVASMGSS